MSPWHWEAWLYCLLINTVQLQVSRYLKPLTWLSSSYTLEQGSLSTASIDQSIDRQIVWLVITFIPCLVFKYLNWIRLSLLQSSSTVFKAVPVPVNIKTNSIPPKYPYMYRVIISILSHTAICNCYKSNTHIAKMKFCMHTNLQTCNYLTWCSPLVSSFFSIRIILTPIQQ